MNQLTDYELSYILSLANKKIQQSSLDDKLDISRCWSEAVIEVLKIKGMLKQDVE